MKIKRKPIFFLGIIDLILGAVCVGMLIAGRGNDMTLTGAICCTIAGIFALLDSTDD